jgi:hypothetical protein
MTNRSVELTLHHAYDVERAPFERYLAKILVAEDPKSRLATFAEMDDRRILATNSHFLSPLFQQWGIEQ